MTNRTLDVPRWLSASAAWAWRLLLVGFTILAVGWLALRVRVVVIPFLIALMLASVLSPLAERLARRKVPKLAATWMVLLGAVMLVGLPLFGVGWGLTNEFTDNSDQWESVGNDTRAWLNEGPVGLSEDDIASLEDRAKDTILNGIGSVGTDRASLVLEIASGVLLSIALTFFFVRDGKKMWQWILTRVDMARREMLDRAGRAAIAALSAYLRAVALTGLVDASFIGIGLVIIGVPMALELAVLTFFAAFIPIVGATVAGALAALVALLTNGVGDALLVVALTLVVQQVEGDVVMPVVMGRRVPLHPAVVLAALTAGGAISGVLGAFVAVPVAAVIAAAMSEIRSFRNVQNLTELEPG